MKIPDGFKMAPGWVIADWTTHVGRWFDARNGGDQVAIRSQDGDMAGAIRLAKAFGLIVPIADTSGLCVPGCGTANACQARQSMGKKPWAVCFASPLHGEPGSKCWCSVACQNAGRSISPAVVADANEKPLSSRMNAFVGANVPPDIGTVKAWHAEVLQMELEACAGRQRLDENAKRIEQLCAAIDAEKAQDRYSRLMHFDVTSKDPPRYVAGNAVERGDVVVIASGHPIPMLLDCPFCHAQHIDEGPSLTTPHRTHACQKCGRLWSPAVVPTVGVKFLPGCKNGPDGES